MDATLVKEYKANRKVYRNRDTSNGGKEYVQAVKAMYALNIARDELALRQAEDAGRITFVREYDQDYQPDGDYDLEEEARKLNSGEWEVWGVRAYIPHLDKPHTCPHCMCEPVETIQEAASLWSIVVDASDENGYLREVERELAREAGVI